MTPVVYRITNVNSGRFYIGSTKDFNDRVKSHTGQFIGKVHHNKQMQEDYNQGDKFKYEVLFILDTREEAFEYEDSLLKKFRGNKLLYNIGRSARGGDNLTDNPRREAIVEQMRQTILERYGKMTAAERKRSHGRPGAMNGMFGKTHSQEAKKKISEARIGNVPANANPISISGTRYGSYREASDALDIPVVTIRWRVISENPKYTEWKFA